MANIIYSDVTVNIAKIAKALGHPARLAILKHLSNQSCCYTSDLIKVIPMAQSTISQHLKELKNAGLIVDKVELPKIKYSINKNNWNRAQRLFTTLFNEDFTSISCC